MSVATRDGAWISEVKVTRLDCTKCGTFLTSQHAMNDRETESAIREHAREHHGGIDR